MRSLIISFVFGLLIGPIYAQSTYYPLIETGKTWHVAEFHYPSIKYSLTYKCEGDTLINSHLYKVLLVSDEEFPTTWSRRGFIREDEERKIYYSPIGFNDSAFQEPKMVYDFNAGINDTISITSFAYNYPVDVEIVITVIDSILINDSYRKRTFYGCAYSDDNYWIEGIGSDNGLTGIGLNCYDGCTGMKLLCVKNMGELLYMNDYYNDCYIVGIDENEISKQAFLVYPNPAKNDIYILPQTKVGSDLKFELYDLENKAVLKEEIVDYNQTNINIINLKDGLYLYRIINNSEMVQNGKIIIRK